LAMVGGSYLGFVQWAVAADAGPDLKALVPQITTADFNHFRFQGGFTLESSLGWSTMMTKRAATGLQLSALFGQAQEQRRLSQAFMHLPLKDADKVAINQPSQSFQNMLAHGPDDEYWKPVNYGARVPEVTTPIYLQAGWYDLFLD